VKHEKRKIRFALYKGKNGRWYWRGVSSNGNIMADCSEGDGYGSRVAARRSLASLVDHIASQNFEIEDGRKG
jgi:uncharacterized protein YegP (UPF0339 family)